MESRRLKERLKKRRIRLEKAFDNMKAVVSFLRPISTIKSGKSITPKYQMLSSVERS